jgi:hypothetical protein
LKNIHGVETFVLFFLKTSTVKKKKKDHAAKVGANR